MIQLASLTYLLKVNASREGRISVAVVRHTYFLPCCFFNTIHPVSLDSLDVPSGDKIPRVATKSIVN